MPLPWSLAAHSWSQTHLRTSTAVEKYWRWFPELTVLTPQPLGPQSPGVCSSGCPLWFPLTLRTEPHSSWGVKLIFTGGHVSLTVAFKGPNVIVGLYECNYSLIFK